MTTTERGLNAAGLSRVWGKIKALITPLQTAVEDLSVNKANIDGLYENLTSGNALQLISDKFVTDQEPYNFRTSGGSADIGNRSYDTIVGCSIIWNQLAPELTDTYWAANYSAGTTGTGVFSGGRFTGHLDSSTSGSLYIGITANPRRRKPQVGHKYLISATVQTINGILSIVPAGVVTLGSTGYNSYPEKTRVDYCWEGGVLNDGTTLTLTIRGYTGNGVTSEIDYTVEDVNCIDLTAALGSTIADYVYSLEAANAGDGADWFKKYFPGVYYGFAEPQFEHVQVSAKNTVGFNQWDEEWEVGGINASTGQPGTSNNSIRTKNFIRVLPGTKYYIHYAGGHGDSSTGSRLFLRLYDEFYNYIGNPTSIISSAYTIPANVKYIKFVVNNVTTYNSDICINISWSGTHDGEYEEYQKRIYPISPVKLRGKPMLGANGKLYYDGDIYEHDGTITRRYPEIDMGTMAWSYDSTNQYFYTSTTDTMVKPANGEIMNIRAVGYTTVASVSSVANIQNAPDKSVLAYVPSDNFRVIVKDSAYTTAADFKAAVSGQTFVYEANEPTTETADTYQYPMVVNDWGTEEFVDYVVEQGDRDISIPVGHITQYQPNNVNKIDHLPSIADADGRYSIQQTGTQMSLVPDTSPGRLDAVEAKLPDPPETDGTYTLKATVSNGSATYAYVSES